MDARPPSSQHACANRLGLLIGKERKEQRLTQEQFAAPPGAGMRLVHKLEAGEESCQAGRALPGTSSERFASASAAGARVWQPYSLDAWIDRGKGAVRDLPFHATAALRTLVDTCDALVATITARLPARIGIFF